MSIFALSTATGKAGIAVIRISGPESLPALHALGMNKEIPARQAMFQRFTHPTTGDVLDEGLALFFPGPYSFTGEDVVELQIHGGPAVVDAFLEALATIPGLYPAEPGAFSRIAFQNGKLDLTAAEGLADMIDAETETQRRQALRQMQGELGRNYATWRESLLKSLAFLEAHLDFPDEDLPPEVLDEVFSEVRQLQNALAKHLADNHRGERIRTGLYIAVVGPPNAGKSTLINHLARRDIAIVSPQPGTTRDVIEAHLDLAGYAVTIADTAGLRETSDEIEREGVRRAQERAEQADLRIILRDASQPNENLEFYSKAWPKERTLEVWNKADKAASVLEVANTAKDDVLFISLESGHNLPLFLDKLAKLLEKHYPLGESASITRPRHRKALEDANSALDQALSGTETELVAEELRIAANALGRITGQIGVEDILDRIFSSFCIGK